MSAPVPDNPWGATTKRTLRLYQLGCFLFFLNVALLIALIVLTIVMEET